MTGTQIAYYFLCKRKLWLFANNIEQEQFNDTVAMGKFISDSTYERKKHEIEITDGKDRIVLDYYDYKTKTIHEIKKSDKMEESHTWQVKYYISILESKGIKGAKGKIDYPKLRKTEIVGLTEKDKNRIMEIKEDVESIINSEKIPEVINKSFCKKCAYYDLCYV